MQSRTAGLGGSGQSQVGLLSEEGALARGGGGVCGFRAVCGGRGGVGGGGGRPGPTRHVMSGCRWSLPAAWDVIEGSRAVSEEF